MAWSKAFTCDVCGKQKGTVNHWWLAYDSPPVGFMVAGWAEELASNDKVQSLCGQECVIQAVNRWMQERVSARCGS